MSFLSKVSTGCVLWLLATSGCFLRPQTVIDRFSAEFRCPKEQVKVEQPDKQIKEQYRATGCNRRANYRCSGDYGEFCERLGQPETITPESGELSPATPIGGATTTTSAGQPSSRPPE